MNPSDKLVSLQDINKARKVISKYVVKTPLISATALGKELETNLFLKAEVFQKIGSFKLRGIMNKFQNLTEEEKRKGVIAISSGNHAQSLAYAASQINIHAVVVMPTYSAKNKIKATKDYGAEVIIHEDSSTLMEHCLELMENRDLTLVHPFDDPKIIAGQGTIGLEVLEDLDENPDLVVVPVGGGGLIAGIATAIKLKSHNTKVIGVEPTGANAMYQSLQKKSVVALKNINTIADGLAAPFAGKHTLAHVMKFVDDIILVSDKEILESLRNLLFKGRLVTEPAGAAGFAALMTKKIGFSSDSNVVCILSGGNVDTSILKRIFET
ncbi:MAG: threonine ammonia-lyase [Candidatus Hodarchaeales archaeon]|jgi:threonine dehydratase